MTDKFKTNPFAQKYKASLEKRRGEDDSASVSLVKRKRSAMERALKAKRNGAKEIKDSDPFPKKNTKDIN